MFAFDPGVATFSPCRDGWVPSLAGVPVSLFLLCAMGCSDLFFPLKRPYENCQGNNSFEHPSDELGYETEFLCLWICDLEQVK